MTGVTPKVWVIDPKDNAGTVIGGDIGLPMRVQIVGGATGELQVSQPVPYGHKVALSAMPAGSVVIKYGVVIGSMRRDVRMGEHVHVHNLESLRGRGDLEAPTGSATA